MSHWLTISDWQHLHEPVREDALRRLELFEVYMAKRRAARTRAAKYQIPPFKPLTKSTD